jgi:hypothetical protein
VNAIKNKTIARLADLIHTPLMQELKPVRFFLPSFREKHQRLYLWATLAAENLTSSEIVKGDADVITGV